MRVLKFRAWDCAAKRMSEPFVLFGEFTLMGAVHSWQGETIPFTEDRGCLTRLNDLTVMQFTGLLDKNGIEIYEGDVVRFNVRELNDQSPEVRNENGEVKINPFISYGYWDAQFCDEVRVIGNIYESPELLK